MTSNQIKKILWEKAKLRFPGIKIVPVSNGHGPILWKKCFVDYGDKVLFYYNVGKDTRAEIFEYDEEMSYAEEVI